VRGGPRTQHTHILFHGAAYGQGLGRWNSSTISMQCTKHGHMKQGRMHIAHTLHAQCDIQRTSVFSSKNTTNCKTQSGIKQGLDANSYKLWNHELWQDYFSLHARHICTIGSKRHCNCNIQLHIITALPTLTQSLRWLNLLLFTGQQHEHHRHWWVQTIAACRWTYGPNHLTAVWRLAAAWHCSAFII